MGSRDLSWSVFVLESFPVIFGRPRRLRRLDSFVYMCSRSKWQLGITIHFMGLVHLLGRPHRYSMLSFSYLDLLIDTSQELRFLVVD